MFLGSGYPFSTIENKLYFYGYIFPFSKHLGSLFGSPWILSGRRVHMASDPTDFLDENQPTNGQYMLRNEHFVHSACSGV